MPISEFLTRPLRRASGALAAALLLVGAAWTAPAIAAKTLKVATLAPDGTAWMREMKAGAAAVAERTAGRLQIKFYPGGVMGNDAAVMRKIRIGQLHGAALTGGEMASVYPDAQLYNLPFLFRDYGEVDYVRERVDPLLLAGMEKAGWLTVGMSEGGFAYLMSREPVSAVDDLRGRKVWVPKGDVVAEAAFRNAGLSPVSLPVPDVYTALQTNLIDTTMSSAAGAIALQWHTRIRYYTDVPLSYLVGLLSFSKQALRGVSEADVAVLREEMGRAFGRMEGINRSDNEAALAALHQQGIKAVHPQGAELPRWHEFAASAISALADSGAYTPGLLDTVRRHLADYRAGRADR